MCGTFLVRSGILNSVHTFANDPSRGIFILIFLFILILISLIIFFIFYKQNTKEINKIYFFSKETSILINNWFIMYFLSVVLIGTIYPIFLEVLINEKISIGPPFFNKLLIPFLAIFLIFMSIAPKLNWIKDNFGRIKYLRIILFFICLIVSFYLVKKTSSEILFTSVLGGAAVYLLFISIEDLFKKTFRNYSQRF